MEASPTVLMAMWASGLAAGGALVAAWNVVGRGYVWLTSGVVVLAGIGVGLITSDWRAWLAAAVAASGAVVASRTSLVIGAFSAASLLFLTAGLVDSPALPLASGALFLGAITTEMMLGHWFLVDPQLPRWSLTRLAWIGGTALLIDAVVLVNMGLVDGAASDPVLGWAFAALAAMTGLLVVGVILSLREPSYAAVMAATGLSYLATLTAFGVAVVGRMLAP